MSSLEWLTGLILRQNPDQLSLKKFTDTPDENILKREIHDAINELNDRAKGFSSNSFSKDYLVIRSYRKMGRTPYQKLRRSGQMQTLSSGFCIVAI